MDQQAIDEYNKQSQNDAEHEQLLKTITNVGDKVSKTVATAELHTKKVTVTNDLAKPSDIDKVVQAVNNLSGELKPKDLQPLADALIEVRQAIAKLPTDYPEFPSFPDLPEQREDVKVTNLSELKEYFKDVVDAVGKLKTSIKFDPKIEVKPADVKVTENIIDVSSITKGLVNLENAFKAIKTPQFDTTEIILGLDKVSTTLGSLKFPVPNYVLPFKDINGNAVQVQLDASGKIPLSTSAATSTRQDDQIDILNLIQSGIQSISGAKGVAADLRTTILSGTVTTVGTVTTLTTLTTLSNITSIGGLNAAPFMQGQNNQTAVQSNINNVVVT